MGNTQRTLLIVIGSVLAVMVGLIVLVFVDSAGPAHWTAGTIISTHYSEGITTHSEIDVGNNVKVPMTTEVPSSWILEIDSAALGRQSVASTGILSGPASRCTCNTRSAS